MARKVTIPGCTLDTISLKDIDEGTRFREDYGDLTSSSAYRRRVLSTQSL